METKCIFRVILTLIIFAPSISFSQNDNDGQGHTLSNPPDGQPEINYERGYFLKSNDSEFKNSVALNYPKEYLLDPALSFLKLRYDKADSSHIVLMDITDAEYDLLMPYVEDTLNELRNDRAYTEYRICETFKSARKSNFLDISMDRIIQLNRDNHRIPSNNRKNIYNNLLDSVEQDLGIDVFDQFVAFINEFGKVSTYSTTNSIDQLILEGKDPIPFLNSLCK